MPLVVVDDESLHFVTLCSLQGIFSGNTDSSTQKTSLLAQMVFARYVKVAPTAWSNHISMRMSVLVGQGSNGPTTGSSSLMTAGPGDGVVGVCARVRVGRAQNEGGMDGGSGCEASVWASDSGAVCKVGRGVGGSARRGRGLAVVVSGGLQQGSLTQAWSYAGPSVAHSVSVGCYLADPPQSAYSFSSCWGGACGSNSNNLIKLNSVQCWAAGVGDMMIASFCVACIMLCGACSICDEACFKFVFS